MSTIDDGRYLVRPKVVDAGYHTRRLLRLTGLDAEENQARKLLNDLDAYRAESDLTDEQQAAHRWLTEVFEPVVRAVPAHLRRKLEPQELFAQIIEHKWLLSEQAGRDVGMRQAVQSYLADVLVHRPDEQAVLGVEVAPTSARRRSRVGRRRRGWAHSTQEPPRITRTTFRSSSSTTRSARRPTWSAPDPVARPMARAGVVATIRQASAIGMPACTACRSAASMVSVLPAIAPSRASRATPSATVTAWPPSSYSPSGMPAAAIASVISAARSGPGGRGGEGQHPVVQVHPVGDQLADHGRARRAARPPGPARGGAPGASR